jgi:stage V sporulation protein R
MRESRRFYLIHRYEGVNLDWPFAQATLNNLYTLWKRPVHIETKTAERGRTRLSHGADGSSQRQLD